MRMRQRAVLGLALGLSALALLPLQPAGAYSAETSSAAGPTLTVDDTSIAVDESVTVSYDAAGSVHDRNWIGFYRDGDTPGGPASLDWKYVPDASGTATWSPSDRAGWTKNTASIGPGDYDVYLLEDDGYRVLAGPIDLEVEDAAPEPPAPVIPPADPKQEVDGVSELNVLTFNVWYGGTQIDDGAQEIANVIRQADADVTFMPEVGNAPAEVAALLGYDHYKATDTGIVSRYPIVETDTIGRWWTKAVLDVNGTEVVAYGGHLEYRWYANYLPRGYGGEVLGNWPAGWGTWNQLDAPVTDVEAILAANDASGRPAAAAALVQDVDAERIAGRIAVVGGDFNEPSAQDWTAATAGMFDHNGTVIPWQTTQTLLDAGLVDAFREVHPDPVANPGITWPADNELFPTSELTWTPKADERDRIDYVFVTPDDDVAINDASVVGPSSSIVRNQRVEDDSDDVIITPDAVWPSDHKAVLASFDICDDGCVTAPAWDASVAYTAGAEVSFEGSTWRATWWTENQRPGEPNGPWQEITERDGVAEWTASRIFQAGEVAVHDGTTYTARWWTRNQEPGTPHGPWQPQD